MHSILIFIAASVASFIGSLQLGPVNLFVIDTVLTKGKKNALYVCLGGSLPEFVYCAIAVYSGSFFLNQPTVYVIFKIILILILIALAFIYFFKKQNKIDIVTPKDNSSAIVSKNFIKGFTLALLNPQLLVFWMFVMVYFNSINFLQLKTNFNKLAYILGAGFGAFVLLLLITVTISKFKAKPLTYLNNKNYNKILAVLFSIIAIQQLTTLL